MNDTIETKDQGAGMRQDHVLEGVWNVVGPVLADHAVVVELVAHAREHGVGGEQAIAH